MQFPYTQVAPGIFRPQIPLYVKATKRAILVDGILDPGSDRTLILLKHAIDLELDLDSLTSTVTVRSATGQVLKCKTTILILELLRDFERISWQAEVAIAPEGLGRPHWGFKGFLEFFRAVFDGRNQQITLEPGANLPRTTAPA